MKIIEDDKARGDKLLYLFDGMHHETIEGAWSFLTENLGSPSYMITTTALPGEIEARLKESKEMGPGDELGEEDQAELKEKAAAAAKEGEQWAACAKSLGDRIKNITFETGVSKETLGAQIRSQFCIKVILVNHEKRLSVDVVCSNLAIKYNMLFLSVYQLIKNEIESNTAMGKQLLTTKKAK